MSRSTCALCVYALLSLTIGCRGESPAPPNMLDVGDVTSDRNAAKELLDANPDEFAWKWFLWLNSPLRSSPAKEWETRWRQTSTVYLKNGSRPEPWGKEPPPPEDVLKKARGPNRIAAKLIERGEHAPGAPFAYIQDPDGFVIELFRT